jgi:predicted MFS family arabinose efflux permease
MNPRLYVLGLASFAMGTEAYVYAGHLGSLARDAGVTVPTAGQLATAFSLTYAISAPVIAGFVAAFNRRTVVASGLGLIAFLNLLASQMSGFEGLLVIRILCGLAAALVGPIASVAAAELAPEDQRGKAMAVVLGGMTLSFVAGIPAGSLIGDFAGWRGTFLYASVVAVLAAVIVRSVLPSMPGRAEVASSVVDLVSRSAVVVPLLLTLLGFAATFAVIAYLGPVVTVVAGLSGSGIGAIQAFIGLGSIVGVIVGARFADRPAAAFIMAASFLMSAISLSAVSLLFLATGKVAIVGLGAAIAAGAAALFCRTPLIQVRLVKAAPAQRSVLLALNGSMVFFGQGLGAALGGAVIGFTGLAAVGWAGGAVALFSTMIAWLSRSRPEDRPLIAGHTAAPLT